MFVAVLPHLLRLPWLISLPVLVLFVLRWLQRRRGRARLPAWIKLPLVLLFPILIVFHYGNLFGREPGSALACAMLALKLMETENRRDARAAICFSAFVLMSALLFDNGLWMTVLLCAALVVLLAALRALESARSTLLAGPAFRCARPRRRAAAGCVRVRVLPAPRLAAVGRAERHDRTHGAWRPHGARHHAGIADRRQPCVPRRVRRHSAAARQALLARPGAMAVRRQHLDAARVAGQFAR